MKKLIEHLKQVAIEDTRLFFEPYVKVGRFVRRLGTALLSRLNLSKKGKDGNSQ